jgi:hypothetical protein
MPVHYAGREVGILDIFSEYSLKLPRMCSNILDISLSGEHEGLPGEEGGRSRRAHKQPCCVCEMKWSLLSVVFNHVQT